MWIVLTILLWLLAAVIALLLVALVSPLRIEAKASVGEAFRYSLALRLFGRVGPRVVVADSATPPRKKKPKTATKKAKHRSSANRAPMRIIRAAFPLISVVLACLHIDKAMLDLRFGADDPAETGQIFGILAPMVFGVEGGQRFHFSVEPVFDRAVFDGCAAVDVTMIPARLIYPVARFGWSAFGPRSK